MTMIAGIRIPRPPGASLGLHVLRRTVEDALELAGVIVGFARAVPRLANSLERLADLQDELAALGEFDLHLERLADLQDELATLGRLEGALDRIAEFGTPLDNLTQPVADLAVAARSLPELAVAAQSLPELVTQVKLVEQIVERMDHRLDELTPKLDQIAAFGTDLGDDIDDLGDALAPISRLASRLPGSRRRRDEPPRKGE